MSYSTEENLHEKGHTHTHTLREALWPAVALLSAALIQKKYLAWPAARNLQQKRCQDILPLRPPRATAA